MAKSRLTWTLIIGLFFVLLESALFGETFKILNNPDDGTEVNRTTWHEDGFRSLRNYLGRQGEEQFEAGFRFHLQGLQQGDKIALTRLRFASFGGKITSSARLLIQGVRQSSPTSFSQEQRPSQKSPRTQASVLFQIDQTWHEGFEEIPLFYESPDIAPILNEILALPDWGQGSEGKTLILTIQDRSEPGKDNYLICDDLHPRFLKSPVTLELYKEVYDTFLGKEFLGRVTDQSAAINLFSLLPVDTFIEYGPTANSLTQQTPIRSTEEGEKPIVLNLDGLQPNRRYHYRLAFRKRGTKVFQKGQIRSFHTQRPRESGFTFAVQADEHLQTMYRLPVNEKRLALYKTTLNNIQQDQPDFLISMGDFAHTEFNRGRSALHFREARNRYLEQRALLDSLCHSIPFYLVMGNHEGEEGWQMGKGSAREQSLAFYSGRARKEILLNPYPDRFYSGNPEEVPGLGLRENYYAWEWGDAIFVVLDPFYCTLQNPSKIQDGWGWTLGKAQYDWLYEQLHASKAEWKIVLIHHLTSTAVNTHRLSHYGRGGIEVAKYRVDQRPSFEWGGENEKGENIFAQMRPGWSHGPVHDMLVKEGVDLVLNGHDHCYGKQDLDGLVYQACPQPGDASYGKGALHDGKYKNGVLLGNSGHLRVSVDPDFLQVDYVRSYLPGEGENGKIGHSYRLEN